MKYLMSASVAQHEFSTHLPAELSESKADLDRSKCSHKTRYIDHYIERRIHIC